MNRSVSTPRLGTYVTLGLSAGILGTAGSDAAVMVYAYGPGAQSFPETPSGINIGLSGTTGYVNTDYFSRDARIGFGSGQYFTRGNDLGITNWSMGQYSYDGVSAFGALLGSNQNYASISFDGDDGVYEAVGQFYLDGIGGGYLVSIARNDDNTALSISAGKTAIDSIPEPSSIALLALGAAGVLARRRRAA